MCIPCVNLHKYRYCMTSVPSVPASIDAARPSQFVCLPADVKSKTTPSSYCDALWLSMPEALISIDWQMDSLMKGYVGS